MAVNNSMPQQRQTTFQIIEPLFYREFNTYPVFPEWTLEQIPRNNNPLDKYKMSGCWLYKCYNTKGRSVVLLFVLR